MKIGNRNLIAERRPFLKTYSRVINGVEYQFEVFTNKRGKVWAIDVYVNHSPRHYFVNEENAR